jgi:hypothetical protein
MQRTSNRTIRRVVTFGVGVAMGLSFLTGTASAATSAGSGGNQGQTSSTKDCDGTHHSKTGHGANTSGAYDNTCDGSPSRNGSDTDGTRGSRPCAGCVGNADDKNPPGQYPDGPTDHNNGYECDQKGRSANEGNNGVGFGNPAHTGCTPAPDNGGEEPAGSSCPAGDAAMTQHDLAVAGGHGTAGFTIAAGCADLQLSLASYDDHGSLVDSDTGVFGAGDHQLTVDVPACGYEVDFVWGTVVPELGNGANPNAEDDRLIEADKAGKGSCTEGQPATSGTPENLGTSGTPGNPSNLGNLVNADSLGSLGNPAIDGAVIPAPDVAPAVVEALGSSASVVALSTPAPLDVLGVALPTAAPGHPTQVLGVQLERAPEAAPAAAGLAFTGFDLFPLALLGAALLLVGVVLHGGRNRQTPAISITQRSAGF